MLSIKIRLQTRGINDFGQVGFETGFTHQIEPYKTNVFKHSVQFNSAQILTPKLCAWILCDFCRFR